MNVGFAQVLAPIGNPGSPQAAQALDRLAAAVPATPVIPNGSYELTVYEDAGIAESDNGPDAYATTRSTWTAADGWAWAHQTGDEPAYYIFSPAPRNYDLNAVTADPAVMETYLRARVTGSSSVEEALFEAVKETLIFTPTPAATRAASIRMLARVPGVTVTENTTDPKGRPATKVALVDEQHRPGVVNAIYLDPATTQLVAELRTQNGQPYYTCIYTERRIVKSLPDDIIKTLGAGDVVGEVALVFRRDANADVVAVHPTVTLHLPREEFVSLIREHPAILHGLYILAVERDDETSSVLATSTLSVSDEDFLL